MKYHVVVMVPTLVEIMNSGSRQNVSNEAWGTISQFPTVYVGKDEFAPKVLGVFPIGEQPEQPLVFDPPPMAA